MEKTYTEVVARYCVLDKWLDQLDHLEADALGNKTISIDTIIEHYSIDTELVLLMVNSAQMDLRSEHSSLYVKIRKANMKP